MKLKICLVNSGSVTPNAPQIKAGKTYRFPATVLITWGFLSGDTDEGNVVTNMKLLQTDYESRGYLVKNTYVARNVGKFSGLGLTLGEIKTSITDTPYLAVWVQTSHGGLKNVPHWYGDDTVLSGGTLITKGNIDPSTGDVNWDSVTSLKATMEGGSEGLFAKDFTFNYKLSDVYMYVCGAGLGDWKTLLAPDGKLHASKGKVNYVGGNPLNLPIQ